jgi:hypothetical protein
LAVGGWAVRFDEDVLGHARQLLRKQPLSGVRALSEDPQSLTLMAQTADGGPLAVTVWPEDGGWELETSCRCGYGPQCAHAAALLLEVSKPGRLARLMDGGALGPRPLPAVVRTAAEPPPARVVGGVPRFLLEVRREPTDSKIVRLLLQALKLPDSGDWIALRPSAIYEGERLAIDGRPGSAQVLIERTPGPPVLVNRDAAREMERVSALQQVGLTSVASHAQFRFLLAAGAKRGGSPADGALWFPNPGHGPVNEYWAWLRTRGRELLEAAGWELEFGDDVGHEVVDVDPADWNVSLTDETGGSWFHLSVGFEVGGKKLDLLPILADLLAKGVLEVSLEYPPGGQLLYHLPDGAALRLPVDRVRKILQTLAAFIDPRRFHGGRMPIHPLDAAALTSLAELGVAAPPALQELTQKLHAGAAVAPLPAPDGLRAELRSYQLDGFRWMRFLSDHGLHGILADDMGLGKTLQTIAWLLDEKHSARSGARPSLVVAPTSVVPNWAAEIRRFAPALKVLVLEGARRASYFRSIPHADVVLTSYALLQRDSAKLREVEFHAVVLDEAQFIKNPAAKVAQAACRLQCRQRLCLSGTPIENHLGELWSLMRFLMPGFLGSAEDFGKRFRTPIEKDGDAERQAALKARVAPVILRRTKDQVATELPPKTILVHAVELTTAQKDLYETVRASMDKRVRQAIAARGLAESRMVFLEALLKLRQICCHPQLLKMADNHPLPAESAKLDYLAELLDTLVEEGRRVLVFSQFTSMLAIIAQHLENQKIPFLKLTGESKDRGALVEKFQSGAIPVFLISLKAGGTGLNLTAADTVIHYDPWWNPAAEAQATDRAYRIGQDKPVFVHKLLCAGTVEDRIHQLQQKKSLLADALLAERATPAVMDESAVAALLAPLD